MQKGTVDLRSITRIPLDTMSYSCPNDWKRVQVADRFDMALRADVATELAFAEARRQTGSTNPTEPDLVRSFFVHALEEI